MDLMGLRSEIRFFWLRIKTNGGGGAVVDNVMNHRLPYNVGNLFF
jgi:hypothetical protein